MDRVLVIDDEREICDLISELMEREGFKVSTAQDSHQGWEALEVAQPDLALVDFTLPGGGIEFIEAVRSNPKYKDLSVIVITGSDDEMNKIDALETGADDYVVKPFSGKELAARIRAVLRRSRARQQGDEIGEGEEVLKRDGLTMDFKSHRVLRNGEEVFLTLTEFRILGELMKQQGAVLSRDRLRERALGNFNVTDRTIDVHMASLRKKLHEYGSAIQTIRGVGYRYK